MRASRHGGDTRLGRALIAIGAAGVISSFFFPWLIAESISLICSPGNPTGHPARCVQVGPYLNLRSGFDISGTLLQGAQYNLIPFSGIALIPLVIAVYLIFRAVWMGKILLGGARGDLVVATAGLAMVITGHVWAFTTTTMLYPGVIEAAAAMYVCYACILAGIALTTRRVSLPNVAASGPALGA